MDHPQQTSETIIDFITGRPIPNTGAEYNRQQVERFLVETKGYDRQDIEVDAPIELEIDGEFYRSAIDLLIGVNGFRVMVIKCAAGSLASREREVLAAARLAASYQIPLSVASDGHTAIVWDTVTGKSLGEGLDKIPSKKKAAAEFDPKSMIPLDEKRRHRQQLIFRSYDSMNVH